MRNIFCSLTLLFALTVTPTASVAQVKAQAQVQVQVQVQAQVQVQVQAPSSRATTHGSLTIETPWTRATPGGSRIGVGYLTIRNQGETPARLVGAKSVAAERVEIHTMSVTNGIMKMRKISDPLEIAAGQAVTLKPGGLHLMLLGLAAPIKPGDTLAVELEFERTGTVSVDLLAAKIGALAPSE